MAYQKKRVGEVDDERLKFEINTIYSREVIFESMKFYDLLASSRNKSINPIMTSRAFGGYEGFMINYMDFFLFEFLNVIQYKEE